MPKYGTITIVPNEEYEKLSTFKVGERVRVAVCYCDYELAPNHSGLKGQIESLVGKNFIINLKDGQKCWARVTKL